MVGSRVPGVCSEILREKNAGLLTEGTTPGSLGRQPLPLDSGSGDSSDEGKELNLVARYPKPKSWTAAKEKELIKNGTWFPHTLDFLAVAGKGSIEIASQWDFLLKIIKAKDKIGRLNFVSHGVNGLIATSGTVEEDGTNVSMDTGWTQVQLAGGTAIADPYAETWGSEGENSSATVTVGDTSFSLDDVRKKFTKSAVLWLYVCHGGADPMLLQNLANTFQIKATGFLKIIVFCAPADFPTNRNHTVAVKTTEKDADSCPNGVSNFRELTTHTMSKKPKKP
jgi:hypothetical protein